MTVETEKKRNWGGFREGAGRPVKEIDWDLVDKLILRQNKGPEIAGHFNMHHDTFYQKVKQKWDLDFTDYAYTVVCKGHSTLRSRQWEKAMDGNVQMLMYLGQLYLDDQKPKNKDEPDSLANDLASLVKLLLEGKITQPEHVTNI